ncbi:MAG: polyphosphate kinase 2 [Planctomycetota bacterium]
MRAFQKFLEESIEFDHEPEPIETAVPLEHPEEFDPVLRQRYFLEGMYPYPKRIHVQEYYRQKYALQVELVKFQNWVKETQQKVLMIFEGRDAAGKGSTIKRFMEFINPRGARVIALEKPTDRERGSWYFQRYIRHLPGPGEIMFFDRSWYNRAGVERVMGFCTEQEYGQFFEQVPLVERMLTSSGIRLIKFWFSVSQEEQRRRFGMRKTHPLKQWKLSPMDLESERRWDDYTLAKEEMFKHTHTPHAPWTVIKSEDKMRARLAAMRYVLYHMPYAGKDEENVGVPDPWIIANISEIAPDGSAGLA